MAKEKKPNRKRYDDGEISFEEWRKLNYEYFGEDNVDWIENEDNENDDDVTEELNFDR